MDRKLKLEVEMKHFWGSKSEHMILLTVGITFRERFTVSEFSGTCFRKRNFNRLSVLR